MDGKLVDGELADGAIEYPVLTGLFMWGSGALVHTEASYLRITALLLAPFGLLTAYLLARMRGLRALFFAAAPAVVLYAFHNWDLLVVAAAVAGFFLIERRRPEWAAVAFGIGGALKMYPLLFVLPLALFYLRAEGFKRAVRIGVAGVGTWALINLPFLLAGPRGWWITYSFHSKRGPNFDTIWDLGFELFGKEAWSPGALNLVTSVLMIVGFAAALLIGQRRARSEGAYPYLQVSAAMLAVFLLFNKVHSPQYTLWLLPFFVLLGVRWQWWAAYSIVDLAVYVGIFRWFYDWTLSQDLEEVTFAKGTVMVAVWARAALLVLLFFAFLRQRLGDTEHETVSQVSFTVSAGEQPAPG